MDVALVQVHVMVRRDGLSLAQVQQDITDSLSSVGAAELEVKFGPSLVSGRMVAGDGEWRAVK
jgi:hypothetical protein